MLPTAPTGSSWDGVTGSGGREGHVAEEAGNEREVSLEPREPLGRVEGGGRMVERQHDQRHTGENVLLRDPVHRRDALRASGQQPGREVPEGGDDAWPHELELPEQVRLARDDLLVERVASRRRPALEHRRAVDVVSRQADAGQQRIDERSLATGERKPEPVLVKSRRLADEHQLGVRVADPDDDLRPRLGERARDTARDLGFMSGKRGCSVGGLHPGSVRAETDAALYRRGAPHMIAHLMTTSAFGSDITLEQVTKAFDEVRAVDAVSFTIHEGEFFSMLGPSGCGKTTTLRMIAGFEEPTDGRILLRGQDVTHVPPARRNVNMVFQAYALFPHMTRRRQRRRSDSG